MCNKLYISNVRFISPLVCPRPTQATHPLSTSATAGHAAVILQSLGRIGVVFASGSYHSRDDALWITCQNSEFVFFCKKGF